VVYLKHHTKLYIFSAVRGAVFLSFSVKMHPLFFAFLMVLKILCGNKLRGLRFSVRVALVLHALFVCKGKRKQWMYL